MSSTEKDTRGVVVEVWSDIMCPFCYIGHALLGQAVKAFPRSTPAGKCEPSSEG